MTLLYTAAQSYTKSIFENQKQTFCNLNRSIVPERRYQAFSDPA